MDRSKMKLNSLLTLLIVALAGCGWFENQEEALSDFPAPVENVSEESGKDNPDSGSKEKFILNLNQGDRFPMKKTVESTLTQKVGGDTATNYSRLEMLMTISVDQVEENKTLLSVRYQRVKYNHEIGNRKIEYDSSLDQKNLPIEALPYSGLVNNGFQFWLGPDNKILELRNFEQFLERCAAKFPKEERNLLLTHLSASSGDDELANFVDDSIGILPYDPKTGIASVKVGDVWNRKRKFIHPTTMYLDSRCTLRKLSDRYAEIDISGSIAATAAQQHSSGDSGIYIRIRDGKTIGKCIIDRTTGLPVKSKVERFLDMLVISSNGQQFPQQKTIITTIESYPVDGDPALQRQSLANRKNKKKVLIRQASATEEN